MQQTDFLRLGFMLEQNGRREIWRRCFRTTFYTLLLGLCAGFNLLAADRSTYIPYDSAWVYPSDFRYTAFDPIHQQIFTAWPMLDRIDVLSAVDYHVVGSIPVPSPASVDISPDGTTLAVSNLSSHILFFDTGTFIKVDDVVMPDVALGISAFVYTANGNAIIRGIEGLSTGGGITAYWNHATNSLSNLSNAVGATGPYSTTGPLARSGDYSRIMLGDASSGGGVQIIDGTTGQVLQQMAYGGYIDALAANKNASRYAICVEPAGVGRFLIVLDSSYNEIYQDFSECLGTTFSADGNTLYREIPSSSGAQTQGLDMTTFSTTSTLDRFAVQIGSPIPAWGAADNSGVVYGVMPNIQSNMGFVAVDTTTSSTPAVPAVNDPVKIVHVIDSIGSPQGGDVIRILCTGVDTVSAGSVSVTIGGTQATSVAVAPLSSLSLIFPTLPNLRLVEVKTPPGTPGLVDVTLAANRTSDTASKAFQYAQSSKIFPFSTSPSFLLYDDFRKKLYASHQDEVEVIDAVTQQVLTPLVPVSGKLQNSQFAGLSLSPDGNRLYICDVGAFLIHVLDLSNPGTGSSINPTTALAYHSPIVPGRIFETASGKLVGTDASGNSRYGVMVIDRLSGTGTWLSDSLGVEVAGSTWSSTNHGEQVFMTTESTNGQSNCLGLWNDANSGFQYSSDCAQAAPEFAADEDGTTIVAGGSTPGVIANFPQIIDFDLNTAGRIQNDFDVFPPIGTPSFFLHPSGSVLYKAGNLMLSASANTFGGMVEIDDLHRFQPAATIEFPEAFITSYHPFTDHMLATDQTGRYIFAVTTSGISMMVLNTIPLSIGNLQPAFGQPTGGETVTIRGSGFQTGAVASFGGVEAATTFVDENTLTAQVPAVPAGWQDVAVKNTNGISYTAPAIFQVIAAQPTPVLTGFSPAQIGVQSNIPGFDTSLPVTLIGSGFEAYDIVEVNGESTESAYLDASHMQAMIPATLTGVTGSISFVVVSPYTGSSNSLSLPMVNPVPVIDYSLPVALHTASGASSVWVSGTNYVDSSVVQWNGQNLTGSLVQGANAGNGDELFIANVPDNLMTGTGTASITVMNPSPGGGVSNAVTLNLSSTSPQVSFPTSIDFGRVVVNTASTQTIQLTNTGSTDYQMSAISAGSGAFSAQASSCADVVSQSSCTMQVQFLPTVTGAAAGTLTIVDNTSVSPHIIPVTGTGVQSLAPVVAVTSIDAFGQTVQATVYGTTIVGGPSVPAVAWVEYGTDPALATFTQSAQWGFAGDGNLSRTLYGLSPLTTYAVRLAVQTTNGTTKSAIRLFATMAASPWVVLAPATGASASLTINAGQAATFHLVASDGGNGYTGTATFTCAGVPNYGTCTVSPSSASIGLDGTPITVTITTTAPSSTLLRLPPGGSPWALALLFAGFALCLPKRRYRLGLLFCLAVLWMGLLSSCGGSGGGSGPPPQKTPGTPTGTYGVLINGSTGGAQNTYMLTLTVN